jgi:nucleotide-binding universal stress UspA family protein
MQARDDVLHALWGMVPAELAEKLVVRPGRASVTLRDVAAEQDAELIVLGGKHHTLLDRWIAGSTCLDVVRATDVPVLVTGPGRKPIKRVLATVDQSEAAKPTLEAATRLSTAMNAELRVLSVLEPLPIIPEAPNYNLDSYYAVVEEHLTRDVWPMIADPAVKKVLRYGTPVESIMLEAADWEADVVVVGSHGKGWVDRVLIGSVTERLLNRLPTSVLVVPVYARVKEQAPARGSLSELFRNPVLV